MSKRQRAPKKAPYVKKEYANPGIPYAVSQPNKFWRIKKDLPPADYWKKRYWRRRITGRGDYVMDASRSVGHQWGGYAGAKVGEFVGSTAQTLLGSLLTGMGDYTVKKNVFMKGRLPQVVNQPTGGGTIIRFQEYLTDVITAPVAGDFKIQSFLINAANPVTFPFLSQIAANYEQYEVEGMIFEFRSTSADSLNSTNTALGTVMQATQYDVGDDVFEAKLDMLNYEYSTSCRPSVNCAHMIECAPSQTTVSKLYTLYNQGVPDNADPRLYHLGRYSIATTGFQGTSVNIGELHVTYQVRLLKPKLFVSLGETANFLEQILGDGTTTTPYSDPAPLPGPATVGTNFFVNESNNSTFFIDTNLIRLPPTAAVLYYRIEILWTGTAPAGYSPPTLIYLNCEQTDIDVAPDVGTIVAGKVALMITVKTKPTSIAPTITLANDGVFPSGNKQVEVRIMQITTEFNGV